MDRPAAETLALRALAWAAGNDSLGPFLAAGGLDSAGLRARAGEPELLAAFLDFMLSDDRLAGAFCAAESMAPEKLHAARRALPGAPPEN